MKAEDAAEFMEREKSENRFKTRAAIAIACLAALLAITGLGGNNATKEALNENVLASNDFTFFQAKNQRQTTYLLAANQRSDSVVVFRIDKETGRLTPTGHTVNVGSPVCVKFIGR